MSNCCGSWTERSGYPRLCPPGQELLCASPHLPHCQPCELPWPTAPRFSYPSCPVSKATHGSDPGCHGGSQKAPLWWELLSSVLYLLLARVAISPAPVWLLLRLGCSLDLPFFSLHHQLTSKIWCHPLCPMALAATAAATASQPLCDCGKVSVALKKGPGIRAGGGSLLCAAKRTSGSLVLCCAAPDSSFWQ